jgi:tRNA (adenine22-N1)-methyltransferase
MQCASYVPQGALIADIGTDHAYLPVWLTKSGRIRRAIAADVSESPLRRAREAIAKYGVQDQVEARLSDGFAEIAPWEFDTAVLAGMGGELIAAILSRAPWLQEGKLLILQPMTTSEELRRFLCGAGYTIMKERAVRSEGRVYTVIAARGGRMAVSDPLFPYLGGLRPQLAAGGEEARVALEYLRRELKHLKNCRDGLLARRQQEQAEALNRVIEQMITLIGGTV